MGDGESECRFEAPLWMRGGAGKEFTPPFGIDGRPELPGLVPGGLGVCGAKRAGAVSDLVTRLRLGVELLALAFGERPRLADCSIHCFQCASC